MSGESVSRFWTDLLHLPGFAISCVVVATFLYAGIRYFRHTETTFADLI